MGRRQAFTLVELLVVISIIAMLMGLLIPAVMSAIGTTNITVSMNNQQEIFKAISMYENGKGRYPGWRNWLAPAQRDVTWAVAILPNLGRTDLYETWILGDPPKPEPLYVEGFIAPGDDQDSKGDAYCSYAVNGGQPDDPGPDSRAHGIFQDHGKNTPSGMTPPTTPIRVSLDDVARSDGASQTLLIGENIRITRYNRTQEEWHNTFNWDPNSTIQPVNRAAGGKLITAEVTSTTKYDANRLTSPHPGGAVVTFADGHQLFLKETISVDVYNRLCTPNGSASGQMVLAEGEYDF